MYANLVVELKKHHYSQRGLAAYIGISESSMNDKMNGRTQFTLREAKAIQAVFEGRTLDYLFEEKECAPVLQHRCPKGKRLTRRRRREKGKHMNRYMIVIPAKNRSFLLKCDEGDGMKLETLQKLVSGYVEVVPAALDATWAREEADRLVLLVDEEGRLKCKAANQKATNIAPADVTRNGMQPLMGAAVLALQRGDKLMGFSKHVAEDILKEWL